MDFSEAVRTCVAKYADFNGRATRAEYWWFMLFIVLLTVIGWIWLIVLLALQGEPGPNPYGPAPLATAAAG